MVHSGKRVDYFAMLHDDIAPLHWGPEEYWLDMLIDELEANDLDVLGVVSPIKDTRGMTSIALHHEDDNWEPECRLSMHDVFELPETFTSDDIGYPLLLNTGCWVCKFDMEWARKVHFEINDRIVFDVPHSCYRPQNESEDWYFSRLLHELNLKIGCTRKIKLDHQGEMIFTNQMPWGSHAFDNESPTRGRKISPVPNAFPRDIPGWLLDEEGQQLAELARGKRVLEIGSYCGLSTVLMARTAVHVTAVDYFDGRGTPEPRDTRADFDANIARFGLTHKVEACHPDEVYPLTQYDLVYIDGAHDRDSVARDIQRAVDVLADDGLLVFHDYKHPSHPGVTEAIDDLVDVGGEVISVHKSLAVVRPPAGIPLEV
jgi:SAM-dependent methyltransferase